MTVSGIELRDQRAFIFEDVFEDRDRALAERFGLSIVAPHLVQGGEVVQDIRDIRMVAPIDPLEALQGAPVERFRSAAVFPLRIQGVRQVVQQATELLPMGARRFFEERDRIPEAAFGPCIFALCLVGGPLVAEVPGGSGTRFRRPLWVTGHRDIGLSGLAKAGRAGQNPIFLPQPRGHGSNLVKTLFPAPLREIGPGRSGPARDQISRLVGVAADEQLIVCTQVRNTIRQVGNTIGRIINIDAGEIRAEADGVTAR